MNTNTIFLGGALDVSELNFTDMMQEAAKLTAQNETIECFHLVQENAQGFIETIGQMLYAPESSRAGLCHGGNTQWTDAASAQDAVRRLNADEMAN